MKVSELIAELQKCDGTREVKFWVGWGYIKEIHDISPEDSEGHVLLGADLPPEMYALDYKDD